MVVSGVIEAALGRHEESEGHKSDGNARNDVFDQDKSGHRFPEERSAPEYSRRSGGGR